MKAIPCEHCGASYHAPYEDGLIECRDRLEAEVERLQYRLDEERAEVERLRESLRDHESCVVCEASLVPYDGPLHCEDCIVTDEHYYGWQERRCSTSAPTKGNT